MRLRKNGNARDSARPRELVKVDINEHGARSRDALAQRGIDKLTVVKVPSFHELDEQVATEMIRSTRRLPAKIACEFFRSVGRLKTPRSDRLLHFACLAFGHESQFFFTLD
jgi:hypothetical protein